LIAVTLADGEGEDKRNGFSWQGVDKMSGGIGA